MSRSISTRFRILVEIASRQPSVQQKEVASQLGITVQAVSEQMKDLITAGLVVFRGRGRYSVTPQGVDWLLRSARELQEYSDRVGRVVMDISFTAAIAAEKLCAGQSVALEMREGLLYARSVGDADPAKARVMADADAGTDVAVTNIEGVIPLSAAEVVVVTVPSIQNGGSRGVDLWRLRERVQNARLIAAAGVESLISLRSAGIQPHCSWAAMETVIEAASSGVPCVLVCGDAELARVSGSLAEAGLSFSTFDATAN
ncbi:MAG: winged helix-turn-helix transcriptional regulator [Dehalococcoidia bacterium]|nr:winged helix-turn-helix transcriptional regulator [Dehalococcoidia bacterium]